MGHVQSCADCAGELAALKLARKAIRIMRWADGLDTLACAYAENADFAKAVETEQEALKLARSEKEKQYFAEMIEAFKRKMTYIQYQQAKKRK